MSDKSAFPDVCTPMPGDSKAVDVIDYYLLTDEEKAKLGGVGNRREYPQLKPKGQRKSAPSIDV